MLGLFFLLNHDVGFSVFSTGVCAKNPSLSRYPFAIIPFVSIKNVRSNADIGVSIWVTKFIATLRSGFQAPKDDLKNGSHTWHV